MATSISSDLVSSEHIKIYDNFLSAREDFLDARSRGLSAGINYDPTSNYSPIIEVGGSCPLEESDLPNEIIVKASYVGPKNIFRENLAELRREIPSEIFKTMSQNRYSHCQNVIAWTTSVTSLFMGITFTGAGCGTGIGGLCGAGVALTVIGTAVSITWAVKRIRLYRITSSANAELISLINNVKEEIVPIAQKNASERIEEEEKSRELTLKV